MGFNKKFLDDHIVTKWIEKDLDLNKLFDCDCLIMEGEITKKIYSLYLENKLDKTNLKEIVSKKQI
jgi:hypothetical protein